ncbi:MAG: lytic transglycosylase domain-containing protein [Acidobacteria bacterium]|nr:lytic transglycosylase domain-containing protein [Acidobacteriota bacterium]
MTPRTVLRILLLTACAAALPVSARAQIYSWRDANGTLVLSDRPGDPNARSFPVAGSTAIRTTRPASGVPAGGYDRLIAEHASNSGVSPALVHAVIQVESGYNPRARSRKGALGLMQLMPATMSDYGVTNGFDPSANIRAGVAYLRALLTRYEGNEALALAAYNAGPAAVARHGYRVPPYRETRDYVRRITSRTPIRTGGITHMYKSVEKVGEREIPRYSNVRPSSGDYEILAQR